MTLLDNHRRGTCAARGWRRVVVGIVGTLVLAMLVACGGDATPDLETGGAASTPTETAGATPTEAASPEAPPPEQSAELPESTVDAADYSYPARGGLGRMGEDQLHHQRRGAAPRPVRAPER